MDNHHRLSRRLLALSAFALLATGCSRSVITTAVKADGSFSRKIVFHGPNGDAGGLPGKNMDGLKGSFEMPSGAAWKTKQEKNENEETYTAERDLMPGSVQKQDIAIKSGDNTKPGVFVVNQATVRQTAPGMWEYRETLHWTGKIPATLLTVDPKMLTILKAVLPASLATDANIRPIGLTLNRELWRLLFGPGDPLISSWTQMLMQPEAVERKMKTRMSAGLDKAISAQFGDRLSGPERHALVGKILVGTMASMASQTQTMTDPAKAGKNDGELGDAALTALTFTVKMPGKIVSTNGDRDDFSSEVTWSVYPQAAAIGDVEMIAVCDKNAK